jgi:hypothetical protein
MEGNQLIVVCERRKLDAANVRHYFDSHHQTIIISDRKAAYEAFDPGTGDFDWKRLVKARAEIE